MSKHCWRPSIQHKIDNMGELVAANRFVLKNHQVEVSYTLGATPGIPVLTYQDGSPAPQSFTAAEITTDQTGLGTLVSVGLVTSVDTGGERFGFFLPQLELPRGQSGNSAPWACTRHSAGPTPSRTATRHGRASSCMARRRP